MQMQKIWAIIVHNTEVQKKARELNVRAGGRKVFHLMSQREWKDWLAERVGGARGAMEVEDFDSLKVPQLDPKMVDAVVSSNPDHIQIEGSTLQIEYGYGKEYGGFFARTSVEEEFARKVTAEAVVLPSGRTVEVRCGRHSAKTFVELVEKLERARIARCWATARNRKNKLRTDDPQKVIGWLDAQVGARVEITRTDNGTGVPIYGYVGLVREEAGWRLSLAENAEAAAAETQRGLEALLEGAIKGPLAIPQEEPWKKKSSGWYGTSWSLTGAGSALQRARYALVAEGTKGLTSSNVEDRIETLKAASVAAKLEIGGDHADLEADRKTEKPKAQANQAETKERSDGQSMGSALEALKKKWGGC